MPEIVAVLPSVSAAPSAGELTVAVGGVVSVEPAVAIRRTSRVAGWAPMSASRLTVACCMFGSGSVPSGPLLFQALVTSRPQDHCTVPAPKTRAPLGAR